MRSNGELQLAYSSQSLRSLYLQLLHADQDIIHVYVISDCRRHLLVDSAFVLETGGEVMLDDGGKQKRRGFQTERDACDRNARRTRRFPLQSGFVGSWNQKNLVRSLSGGFRPICKKAFSTSPVTPTTCRRKRRSNPTKSGRIRGPRSKMSFRLELEPERAEASYTTRSLVVR